MFLSEVAEILNCEIKSEKIIQINYLLTDSRLLSFPEESLFFALVTKRNDGHFYVDELYHRGVRAFVVSEDKPEFKMLKDAVFFKVQDTLRALQQLATAQRIKFDIPVIGITGSNGKTIIKEWIFQLLQYDFKIVRSPRSYNSQTGVPLSVWQLRPGTEMGVFEAGISQPAEMEYLQPVIQPTIGIFSNIGDAHSEHFINQELKISEKLKLFRNADYLIYCSDNDLVKKQIVLSSLKGKILNWGSSGDCFLKLNEIQKSADTSKINVSVQNVKYTFCIPFSDDASIENSMHCITLMLHLGYNEQQINERLTLLEKIAMRLEVKDAINQCLLINDSYNSDLSSLGIALEFLMQQATNNNLRRTLVLSDIFQSRYSPEELYLLVAELIKVREINKLIGVGEQICRFAHLFTSVESYFYQTTEQLIQSDLLSASNREVILLKGSRKFQFELLSEQLELIAHETTLDVNLTALIDNLNYFRSKLKPETKVMCMVKAFAYGSGSVEIARILQHHRVDFLAVAVADEGAELRKSGIRIPIVVMNPEKSSFQILFENNLEPEIYSFKLLNEFIDAVGKQALSNYPVHIKIDSGMHRLGFDPEDVPALIQLLKTKNQVIVKSVFSHLAGADDSSLDYFTHQQASVFKNCADQFSNAFTHPVMKHLLNSAGIERFPEYQFDMTRLGIGHYGISVMPGVKLQQVCTLKTILLQIKNVNAGETVGYSRKGILDEDKKIAVLPIGYADGFDRRFSNGLGEVFVGGKRAKIVGNVSMDLITIDITGMDVKEGDTVEIFGNNITITELAVKLQTIPYEILTGISRRVKRVYFQE